MNHTDKCFKFGVQLGYTVSGHESSEVTTDMAKEAMMQTPEAHAFNQELCKIAAAAFAEAGESHSVEGILFHNLANVDTWDSGYNRFSDSVKRSLSKSSSFLPAAGAGAVAAASDGGIIKTTLGLGALGGGVLGSLAFILSRNARQTSSENAELLQKIKAYKELSRDIREDMGQNNAMDSEGAEGGYDV